MYFSAGERTAQQIESQAAENVRLKKQNKTLRTEILELKSQYLLSLKTVQAQKHSTIAEFQRLFDSKLESMRRQFEKELAEARADLAKQQQFAKATKAELRKRVKEVSQELVEAEIQKEQLIQRQIKFLKEARNRPSEEEACEPAKYRELLRLYNGLLSENNELKKKLFRKEVVSSVVYESAKTSEKPRRREGSGVKRHREIN